MPVTSRWDLLELACSMALYVLQVLDYHMLSQVLYKRKDSAKYLRNLYTSAEVSIV